MSQTKTQLVAGTPTQDVTFNDATVNSLNGGPLAGTRNRIINGNFDVWQRGTNTGTWIAPITDYYWPDRWVFQSSGTGGNGSISQQAFTVGQTDVPGEPTFFMRWQITSAASGQTSANYVEQRIEDVRTFAGQTATLSFYAKGTGTLPNIYISQTFGSGGSTQVLQTVATNVVLNSTWTKYTYTVSLPSISGKTIGTHHYVGVTFMVPPNTTYTFDLAQVQLEPGTVATPFERRSYGQELALCQRYFESSYVFVSATPQPFYYKVSKRVAPMSVAGGGPGFNSSAVFTTEQTYISQTTGAFQTLQFAAEL